VSDYPSGVVKIDLETLERHAPGAADHPDVLRAGYERGVLSAAEIVGHFLALYGSRPLSEPEESIALLLSDEYDRLGELLEELAPGDTPSRRARDVWTFASIAAVRSSWSRWTDPWSEIELVTFAWGDLPAYTALRPWEGAPLIATSRNRSRLDRLDALLEERRGMLFTDEALMSEAERLDRADARLAEEIHSRLSALLGNAVDVESATSSDGHLQLTVRVASRQVLFVFIAAEQIHLTDEEAFSEDSDDLPDDVDRAGWAVRTIVNLLRFGAARLRRSHWLPRSRNRIHFFESEEQRRSVLASSAGLVIAEFRPRLGPDGSAVER
jgi:hypothetical protein